MRTKAKMVRRKVQILKSPRPRFVSFVDHGANQTPFAVVKRHDGVNIMKKDRKGAAPSKKGVKRRPDAQRSRKNNEQDATQEFTSGIHKLMFPKTTFKTKKSVESWLIRNQWEDYEVEEDNTDFIVKSLTHTEHDFTEIREIDLGQKGITAYVGKLKDEEEEDGEEVSKAKAKAKASAADEEDAPEPEDVDGGDDDPAEDDEEEGDGSEDDDDSDEDGEDEIDGDGEGDEDSDDEGEEDDDTSDDDDDDSDADEDEEGDADEEGEEEDGDEGDPASDPAANAREQEKDYEKRRGGSDGKTIQEREADEPDPETMPGQSKSPRGPGARKRVKKGKGNIVTKTKHSNPVIDQCIRKFDSYGVYLSGGMTLTEVLQDGMGDGVPPGMNEIFNGLYKSIGNSLKNADNVPQAINTIADEFAETVIAVHGVWSDLLTEGNDSQKAAAKKFFAETGDLQISAKSSNGSIEEVISKAVEAAIKPLNETIEKQGKTISALRKGMPSRKSLGNDDLIDTDTKRKSEKAEEDEDADFIRNLSRKSLLGSYAN